MAAAAPGDFVLTLRPMRFYRNDPRPEAMRLRQVFKGLLRRHRMVCIDVRQVPTPKPDPLQTSG